jgi:hypothetical protein
METLRRLNACWRGFVRVTGHEYRCWLRGIRGWQIWRLRFRACCLRWRALVTVSIQGRQSIWRSKAHH